MKCEMQVSNAGSGGSFEGPVHGYQQGLCLAGGWRGVEYAGGQQGKQKQKGLVVALDARLGVQQGSRLHGQICEGMAAGALGCRRKPCGTTKMQGECVWRAAVTIGVCPPLFSMLPVMSFLGSHKCWEKW